MVHKVMNINILPICGVETIDTALNIVFASFLAGLMHRVNFIYPVPVFCTT